MNDSPRFAIVAGEKSGDMLGAGLMAALREHYPHAEFSGIGGPAMCAQGCHSLAPMERLSVMGFVEPLGRLPTLLKIKRLLESTFLQDPPAAYIGIDSPDFNLLIEQRLRRRGIPVVHYVSPSVWAYRARRIHRIKAAVDLMLTLFPFETAIYEQHGIRATCVGHPLADRIGFGDCRAEQRRGLGIGDDEPVVALLPGSRSGEIARLGPVFLEAALAALQRRPGLRFLLPSSGPQAKAQIIRLLRSARIIGDDQFRVVDDSLAALGAADLALVASGTATLEALLLRRPMIVCYRLAWLSYAIASRLVRVPHFALPNLLAGRKLVPEYVQGEVTAERLGGEIIAWFEGAGSDAALLQEFERIHRSLQRNASVAAAQAIAALLEQSGNEAQPQ